MRDAFARARRVVTRWLPAAVATGVAGAIGLWIVGSSRDDTSATIGSRPTVRMAAGRFDDRAFLDVQWRDETGRGPTRGHDVALPGLFLHLGPSSMHDETVRGTIAMTPGVRVQVQASVRGLVATACLAAAAGVVATIRARRGRRSPTACPACGYDLRATPDRCPECGRAVAAVS